MNKNFNPNEINRTIADMIEDHVLVCTMEGQIVSSNKAMQSYLGYNAAELKQKTFLEIIADVHRNRAKSFFKNVSPAPSAWEEFLFSGKKDAQRLHLKRFQNNNLVYLYGNEKYVQYERIQKKLDVEIANAVRIHKRSLPETLPQTEHISFASLYIPAEELGGDLFDAFKVDNGLLNDYFEQYICFVADVSGHGLDSAMLAVFVKDTIRSFFKLKHIPGQVLSPKEIMHFFVEQYRKEGYPEEYLVCLFMVAIDLKTNELTYCNAGFHISPLLIKDNDNIIELNAAGMPVSTAINADWLKYEDASVQLSPSAALLMMSDGLPEQRSDGEFYENRLRSLIPALYPLKPAHIVQKIHEDFDSFLKSGKAKDDITLLVGKLTDSLNRLQ